jgi:SAM-dependent methyltransferase/pimeloyl-ACP methyl ester carboxylesterase
VVAVADGEPPRPAMGGQLLNRSTPIAETSLRGLHPRSIEDSAEIRRLLERARENHCVFHRGLNTQVDLETAQLERVGSSTLVFRAPNFEKGSREQVFLNFNFEDRPYFFATARTAPIEGGRLVVRIPETIFYSERRDRLRRAPDAHSGDPRRVRLAFERGEAVEGFVMDVSPGGLGLMVQRDSVVTSDALLDMKFLDGAEAGSTTRAQLRNWRPVAERPGWTRIGVVQTKAERVEPIAVEYWTAMTDGASVVREVEPTQTHLDSLEPWVLRFSNSKGERIVSLVDSWGDPRGATAVVIPNGWGQTKEALLPLARTIVATFRAASEPVCVVRFDGIRKRGESYNDPTCRIPGREYLHYAFSQGAGDIEEIARFLRESSDFGVSSVVLVSFSAAAIEARSVLARDRERLISAWISVVGAPDLQSMARSISGGVDLMGGSERDIKFGIQELLGVAIDIDRIVSDGLASGLMFIEDARSDLANITVPITWYHGGYDSWVEFSRVQDVLSSGNASNRRLIVAPTGHQLKNSSHASQAFACIASEIGRLALCSYLSPRSASTREIRQLRIKERARASLEVPDLRCFWRDYLVGRDRSYGIELLNNGSAYYTMMGQQVDLLRLCNGDRVVDLGSGVGAFGLFLAGRGQLPRELSINSIDYVREAHERARIRIAAVNLPSGMKISYIDADLNILHDQNHIPLASGSADAIIASLLLSYLERPELLLMEMQRLLRPGGRLVISSLSKDADISRLYTESAAELTLGIAHRALPELQPEQLRTALRSFLNDASKVLELEDAGAFQFWEAAELIELVTSSGFGKVEARKSLGNPPQAILLSAVRI